MTIESSYFAFIDKERNTIPFTIKNLASFSHKLMSCLLEFQMIWEEDLIKKFDIERKIRMKKLKTAKNDRLAKSKQVLKKHKRVNT